jgi:hypothetical protein
MMKTDRFSILQWWMLDCPNVDEDPEELDDCQLNAFNLTELSMGLDDDSNAADGQPVIATNEGQKWILRKAPTNNNNGAQAAFM